MVAVISHGPVIKLFSKNNAVECLRDYRKQYRNVWNELNNTIGMKRIFPVSPLFKRGKAVFIRLVTKSIYFCR